MPNDNTDHRLSKKSRFHIEGIPWPFCYLYNLIAKSGFFQKHYEWVADDIAAVTQRGRILDIGTGPGWLLSVINHKLPDLELTGVDISAGMVDLAKKNLANIGKGDCPPSWPSQTAGTVPFTPRPVTILQAPAEKLPFPDNHFDIIVSTASMHHWPDHTAALNEIFRTLKPGGAALLYDLVRKTPKPVADQLKRQFGLFPVLALWLHSFEEPFCSPDEMLERVKPTSFQTAEMSFTGGLCRLTLRKKLS